ncbi:Wadjet anti-phage system protein JetD domain-containing protein [Sporosarcina sp. FSL K6-3457]|uniref:Wadjet anti-phage system protein JetD domain-containing protein n=1 Tax=Sporosarcina sp. FSL K6-3457 TaxID=2978204 RepID=UPI0030F8219C
MIEHLKKYLQTLKKKTISIDELQSFSANANIPYEQFVDMIQSLEKSHVITMVKAHGRTSRPPFLANTYRIQQAALKEDYFVQLQQLRLELHKQIRLDRYFRLNEKVMQQDLPYLRKIHQYLVNSGLPTYAVPAPERSFELVGDEKWIEETGGAECLKRVELWDKMNIMPVGDPLMFAVNGVRINENHHIHLIVENKTTYQGLLPALKDSRFTTLIYGSGWKVDKGMESFHEQLLVNGVHTFYYFGDLDRTGISIWYKLHQAFDVLPARAFYDKCLQCRPSLGKETQTILDGALASFLSFFPENEHSNIIQMLKTNHYLPQEVLKTRELQMIWRVWSDAIF